MSLIPLDHRDGFANVSMGVAIRCDCVHLCNGGLCHIPGADLRFDGMRLYSRQKRSNQIEFFGELGYPSIIRTALLTFNSTSVTPARSTFTGKE
jgi:hypothetical protein